MQTSPKKHSFMILNWTYHIYLEDLRRAYRASRESTEQAHAALMAEWNDFEEMVKNGDASMVETDDDGEFVFDHGEHAGERLDELESTIKILRESFVIALHHFWERQLIKYMKVKEYKAEKAYEFLEAHGLSPDRVELEMIRLVANVAKHSAGTSANNLYKINPKLFDTEKMKAWEAAPSYSFLRINDTFVDRAFATMKNAIPR